MTNPANQNPPSFLCDEMLQQLGQWLRVAGYDTAFPAQGMEDRQVLDLAIRQQRWLLTRDRDFLHFSKAADQVFFLDGEGWIDQAHQLRHNLGINWLHRPFTRCKRCNTPLEAAPTECLHNAQVTWQDVPSDIRYCPQCQQLFWNGSHVRRMYRQLLELNESSHFVR